MYHLCIILILIKTKTMLQIYLKSAIRAFTRNKSITLINMLGLSIGMAIFIMIGLYTSIELQNDHYHSNIDRIAMIETDEVISMPMRLKQMIGTDIPGIEKIARISYTMNNGYMSDGKNTLSVTDLLLIDPEALEIFSFELTKGDIKTVLKEPKSLIINETNAKRFFKDENPIGKVLRFNDMINFKVTGVMKDLPEHSSIWAGMLTNIDILKAFTPDIENDFDNWNHYYFLLLQSGSDIEVIDQKLGKKLNADIKNLVGSTEEIKIDWRLNPMTKVYFSKSLNGDSLHHGSKQTLLMYLAVGVFILFIAVINFINISNSAAFKRSKEIGMKKLAGASKGSLLFQLLSESVILSLISLIVALLLFELLYPIFNKVTLANINSSDLYTLINLTICVFFSIVVGLLSGIFPALFLIKFKPVHVLKSTLVRGKGGIYSRRVLFMFQFFISVILISATIIIFSQVRYVRNQDLGFNKENIIYFTARGGIFQHFDAFKAALKNIPGVERIAATSSVPGYVDMRWGASIEGVDRNFNTIACDEDFVDVLGLKLVTGRTFEATEGDIDKSFIVNEAFVKEFNVKNPIGTPLRNGHIIGVVKNFTFKNANSQISPIALAFLPTWCSIVTVRVSPINSNQTLKEIEKVWQQYAPAFPFNYKIYKESFDKLYNKEQRFYELFGYFSILAILIACLGIAGLALYTAKIKTREISVRRVFGATQSAIINLMLKEYTRWIIIAGLLALPVAFYVMEEWLSNYAYRISIHWWIFIVAIIISAVLALSVVTFHAIRVANTDPSKALKHE